MAQLLFCLLAENIITDSATNNTSIINVIENISVNAELPVNFPLMQLVISWERETPMGNAEPLSFRIRIRYQSGNFFGRDFRIDAPIPADKDRIKSIVRMEGIPLNETGKMEFLIEKESANGRWIIVKTIPLNIQSTATPTVAS